MRANDYRTQVPIDRVVLVRSRVRTRAYLQPCSPSYLRNNDLLTTGIEGYLGVRDRESASNRWKSLGETTS